MMNALKCLTLPLDRFYKDGDPSAAWREQASEPKVAGAGVRRNAKHGAPALEYQVDHLQALWSLGDSHQCQWNPGGIIENNASPTDGLETRRARIREAPTAPLKRRRRVVQAAGR